MFPEMSRIYQAGDGGRSRSRWSKSRIGFLFSIVIFLVPIGLLSGCGGWTVTPPPRPADASSVFLSRYGMHSRVALQVDRSRMVEYGYGDWRYYAEGEKGPWRGIVAIATPTDAALGKRSLPFTQDPENFRRVAGADRSERIEVERARVNQLVSHLEGRYHANLHTEIRPAGSPFSFVKDEHPYQLSHNSNHQAVDWLRRLGCEVRGNPVYANFRVVERRR